jgi:hypothetical protein
MPGDKKFQLGDYIEVKDRIALFYQQFPEGRLVTDRVEVWLEIEPARVVVKALAYRTPDDPHPGVGWSWMTLPGKTPYTNGSELENTETSAWGRAIGALGIGISNSIASGDEVKNKAEGELKPTDASGETEKPLGPATREGAVVKGQGRHSDLEWRETPDGYHIGFLLEVGDNKPRPQVVIEGPLAVSLFAALEGQASIEGQKVTVSGDVFEVRAPNRRVIYRIKASAIETAEWRIPPLPEAAQPSAGAPVSVPATDSDLSDLPDEWKAAVPA